MGPPEMLTWWKASTATGMARLAVAVLISLGKNSAWIAYENKWFKTSIHMLCVVSFYSFTPVFLQFWQAAV